MRSLCTPPLRRLLGTTVRWGLGGSWLLLGSLAGAQSTAPVEAQTRQMLAMVREVAS